MTYKLLIVPNVIVVPKYKEFLSFYEAVTGVGTIVELVIKNIGENTFPGGEILDGKVAFSTPLGMGVFTQVNQVEPSQIKNIAPNNTFTVRCTWLPWAPGIWEVKMKIKSSNGEKIEYYQKEGISSLKEDEWVQFLYAVDHHQLDSALLLEELLKKR